MSARWTLNVSIGHASSSARTGGRLCRDEAIPRIAKYQYGSACADIYTDARFHCQSLTWQKTMNTKTLKAIQAAAYRHAERLMEQHRGVFDAQAHHDLLLRSLVMEDLACVIGKAIKKTKTKQ